MAVTVDTAVLELRTDGSPQFLGDLDKADRSSNTLGSRLKALGAELGLFNTGLRSTGSSITRVSTEIDRQPGMFSRLTSAIGPVGTAIAGAFAVTQIISAGKAVVDYAGRITDLSARLKISTNTAQEWEAAFGKSGVSLETVAKAAAKLSSGIVGGDKSTVAVLKALGFELNALKAMKPEDRFNAVADAVGNIQNSAEQLYASKTLFGKSGEELLQGLDGHLSETVARMRDLGIVIDEETIKAADDFGDQLGVMGKQLLALTATVIGPLLPALSGLGNALMWIGKKAGPFLAEVIAANVAAVNLLWLGITKLLSGIISLAQKIPFLGEKLGFLGEAQTWLNDQTDASHKRLLAWANGAEKTGEAAKTAVAPIIGLGHATDESGKSAKAAADLFEQFERHIKSSRDAAADAGKAIASGFGGGLNVLRDMAIATGRLQASWVQLVRNLPIGDNGDLPKLLAGGPLDSLQIPQFLTKLPVGQAGIDAGGKFLRGFSRGIAAAPQLLMQAFTGGGGTKGAFQALGVSVTDSLFGEKGTLSHITDKVQSKIGGLLGKGLGKSVGSALGEAIGGLLPGIGGLVAPLIGKIGSMLKDAFGGPSKKELEGRGFVANFEKQFKSTADMIAAVDKAVVANGGNHEKARALIEAMWKAEKQGAEASQRAVDAINAELDRHARVMDAIHSAGFQSREELEGAAMVSHDVLEEMQRSGQYTQDQINQAYYNWQKAMADAGNAAAAAWVKAHDAAVEGSDAASAALSDLIKQRDQLSASIAGEAPEEVMGVIEQQTRAQIALLDKQIEEQRMQMENAGKTTAETVGEALVTAGERAAKAIEEALAGIDVPLIRIPVELARLGSELAAVEVPEMAAGAYLRASRPSLAIYGEAGPEDAVFGGAGRNLAADIAAELSRITGGSGGGPTVLELHNTTTLDGDVVARNYTRRVVHDVRGVGTTLRKVLAPA